MAAPVAEQGLHRERGVNADAIVRVLVSTLMGSAIAVVLGVAGFLGWTHADPVLYGFAFGTGHWAGQA